MINKTDRRSRRRRKVRGRVHGSAERPRLSVFRSSRGVVAQLIDDDAGRTIVAANWTEPDTRTLQKMDQAGHIGRKLAERAVGLGIERCVFDRGGYLYHGRVKALADGARQGGLKF